MENIIIEQQNNYLNRKGYEHQEDVQQSRITAAHKIKRSLSHRRKLGKKLPLIKKVIETESSFKQNTERLIETIIDCNNTNLKKSLNNGANVNAKYNNWSLLHYACSMIEQIHCGTDEHLELIKILLEHGAMINAEDDDRWTPLHLACQLGVTRLISYLIQNGADKDACTVENLRPIDLVEPDNYIAVSFLISGVDSQDRCL